MKEKLIDYLLPQINIKSAAYRYWIMIFIITIIPQIRIAEINGILPSENEYNFGLILNYTTEITIFSFTMAIFFVIDCLIEYYFFNSNIEKKCCCSYRCYKIFYKSLVIIVLVILIYCYTGQLWVSCNFLKDYYTSIFITFTIMIFLEMNIYLEILSNFPSNPILGEELEKIQIDIDLCFRLVIYIIIICKGIYIFQNTFKK